jgi:hypothetical protein
LTVFSLVISPVLASAALASYFTALHMPLQSVAIAISRSLVLPAMGLLLLPWWFGDTGVFISIPLAEAITFGFALFLVALVRRLAG